MSTYNLPYKYELEYAHLNGFVSYYLGKHIQGRSSKFRVVFKKDEITSVYIPGMDVCQWNNTTSSDPDGLKASSYSVFNPNYETKRVNKARANHCFVLEKQYGSNVEYVDPDNGVGYRFYVTQSTSAVRDHKFVGYFSKIYLKAGEILHIFGTCDDALYIRFDGEMAYFGQGNTSSLPERIRFFNSWTYTATEDGYHSIAIIGCNVNTLGAKAANGTPLSMTLAPADSKLTVVTSESAKPIIGNTVGDRCRVNEKYGSYTVFKEYIWNGTEWTTCVVGNRDISEDRFFLESTTVTSTQCIYDDEWHNYATVDSETKLSTLGYGTKHLAYPGEEYQCLDKTEVVYNNGAIKVAKWPLEVDVPEATAFTDHEVCIGNTATSSSSMIGLIGNIYGVDIINGTDENEWYPVLTNDDEVALYNWQKNLFVLPTLAMGGKATPGPIIHDHDWMFVTHHDFPMPYDREVNIIHSDGTAWFPEGLYPEFEKTKPYDFTAPSLYIYCVVDNLGNPCLYDFRKNKFIYNLGSGKVFARKTINLHDDWFDYGNTKRIREIPGETILLTGTDVNYAYKMVDNLPDPNVADTKVVIPTHAMDGFSEGQVAIARKVRNVYKWTTVESPTEGVGVPTSIRSAKVGNKVNIRWKDPDDALDPSGTTVARKWKYTRLVRKVGSYPKGPFDGIIVVQNSVRNYYNETVFIDTLPPNINGVWYYKLFAYSDDDVVSTSMACQFTPFDLDWSKMSNYIQTGKATAIFGVGDEITISGETEFTGPDSIWNDLTFVVAGFDEAKPTSSKLKHSITLVSKILPLKAAYDKAWGSYRLVTSGKADKSVEYYVKNGPSSYKKANPQPTPGTVITAEMGYYIRIADSRSTSGTNRWSESALRTWLNAVKLYEYAKSEDTSVEAGKTYYKQNADGTYITVDPTKFVVPNPKKLGWYERTSDTKIDYVSNALPPLLAIKQMDTLFYNCVISSNSITARAAVYSSGYDTTEDRVSIPSYTQVTGSMNGAITENAQINLFTDPTKRIRGIWDHTPTAWWMRSPVVDEGYSTLRYISKEGEDKTTTNLISTAGYGVCLVVVLG